MSGPILVYYVIQWIQSQGDKIEWIIDICNSNSKSSYWVKKSGQKSSEYLNHTIYKTSLEDEN